MLGILARLSTFTLVTLRCHDAQYTSQAAEVTGIQYFSLVKYNSHLEFALFKQAVFVSKVSTWYVFVNQSIDILPCIRHQMVYWGLLIYLQIFWILRPFPTYLP